MRRAVLAVLGSVFLVLASVAGGVMWWLDQAESRPVLLIQRADGNLVLADRQGRLRPLTADGDGGRLLYAHPVPSPDGRSVAYVRTLHGTTVVTSSLITHRIGGEQQTVFESRDSRPFYLHWSPDGKHLAFLTSDTAGMLLRSVNTLGRPVPQRVMQGQPSYFSWTPDGRRLLLHTGGTAPLGSISLWSIGDLTPHKLEVAPALFQAPAWLEDGPAPLAVIRDKQGVALARLDQEGRVQQRLATAGAGMLFVIAPVGRQVAYIPVARDKIGNLHIVGVDGAEDREVTTEPVVTFFWSPDGTQIAYLTETPGHGTRAVAFRAQPRLNLTWNVLDVATGRSRALNSFVPSTEFLNLLPYFDQYAQSIRLWDRTGQRLVYAADDGVWTLHVATGATVRVDHGVLAMWIER